MSNFIQQQKQSAEISKTEKLELQQLQATQNDLSKIIEQLRTENDSFAEQFEVLSDEKQQLSGRLDAELKRGELLGAQNQQLRASLEQLRAQQQQSEPVRIGYAVASRSPSQSRYMTNHKENINPNND